MDTLCELDFVPLEQLDYTTLPIEMEINNIIIGCKCIDKMYCPVI